MRAGLGRDRLEVRHRRAPGAAPADVPAAPEETAALPYVEPEEYGLRVHWQSEAVRIEAAEFLVATRVQEASRRRIARAVARMREQVRAERTR